MDRLPGPIRDNQKKFLNFDFLHDCAAECAIITFTPTWLARPTPTKRYNNKTLLRRSRAVGLLARTLAASLLCGR
jgi:hypothetical protein